LGSASSFISLPTDAQPWRVVIPPVGFDQRRAAWTTSLAGTPAAADAARFADTFQFGAAIIRQTTRLAASSAALRKPSNPQPTADDVMEAGRSLTTPNLARFAMPLTPQYGWSDLVLPEDKMQQLRNVEARVRHRELVQRQWGFGKKLSRGKGLTVLFTGVSGAGKTMAAEVLAGALSLTLHQIDLSCVMSKYIGETEQHLSAIFREAESSQTLLFFDEAEALFGKRTEVKDAHDRYANIEVNYLLQRIEQYSGIVVLATNLHRNLDEAFLRRISEVIEFPMPDEPAREQIWRKHFPAAAPTKDIDFPFLAKQFKLTGGNIRNVALAAAYTAAQENTDIGMAQIIPAVEAEFRKQGRLVMESDLGKHLQHAAVRRAAQ
jgi:SpoVK/Ycf46/Vps4 family AAA+-type ATPase